MAFPDDAIDALDFGSDIRTKINRAIDTQGLVAYAVISAPVVVASGSWVDIPLGVIIAGDTGATLSSGKVAIPATADGLWHMTADISWKNDHAALANHRRRLRLVAGTTGFAQEGAESIFDSSLGDLGTPSWQHFSAYKAIPSTADRSVGVQAWQNSGSSVNVLSCVFAMHRMGD